MNLENNVPESEAVSIGNYALTLLAQPGQGRVMGVTSLGFFLLTQSRRVIFISTESLPGPVQILLTSLPDAIKDGLMGVEVICSPAELNLPQVGFRINLRNARVWQPPELPQKVLSPQEQHRQIWAIIHEILKSKRDATFLPLLEWMAKPNEQLESPGHPINQLIQKLMDLQRSIRENKPAEAGRILDSFLGYGPGLTPSGDDFVWGCLVALNRWQAHLYPQFEVGRLNEFIFPQAQQKASFLSATLIECATRGWADAAMLFVLDSLFTGEGRMNDLVGQVLAYGHSSGVDAFAGMAATFESLMD